MSPWLCRDAKSWGIFYITSKEQVYLNTLVQNGEAEQALLNPGLKPIPILKGIIKR